MSFPSGAMPPEATWRPCSPPPTDPGGMRRSAGSYRLLSASLYGHGHPALVGADRAENEPNPVIIGLSQAHHRPDGAVGGFDLQHLGLDDTPDHRPHQRRGGHQLHGANVGPVDVGVVEHAAHV